MEITPKENASQRTKNRLREHSGFVLLDGPKSVACFQWKEAILVEAEDGWSGWLPTNEIEWKG